MGINDTVVIKFSADSEQARRLFETIDKGSNKAAESVKKSANELGVMEKGFGSLATKALGYVGVLGTLTRALNDYNTSSQKSAELSKENEDILARILTQSGRTGAQGAGTLKQVGDLAIRNGVKLRESGDASTALVSAGFEADDVLKSGGAGDVLLQLSQGLSARGRGENPADLATAMVRMLKGTGQELTAENLAGLAVPMFNLKKNTDVNQGDFMGLAGAAGPLTQLAKMKPNEILSAFSVLRDVMDPSTAATSLSSMSVRLGAGSSNNEVVEGLASMGLKPEDVDFVGEDFGQVMERLHGGLMSMPESQRAGAAWKVARQENIASLVRLGSNVPEYRKRASELNDPTSYKDSVGRELGSLRTAETREEVRDQLQRDADGQFRRKRDLGLARSARERREYRGEGIATSIGNAWDEARAFIHRESAESFAAFGEQGKSAEKKTEIIVKDVHGNRRPATMKNGNLDSLNKR